MFPLLTGFLIVMVCAGFLTSFVSIRLGIAELPKEWIGVVGGLYSLGMVFGSFKSTSFIIRVGHIRAYSTFAAIIGIVVLIKGLIFSPPLWAILRLIMGYSIGSLFIVIESWLLAFSNEENKGRIFALYGIIMYLAYAVAPYVFKLVDDLASQSPTTIATLLAICSILPIITTRTAYPVFESHASIDIKRTFKKAPVGVVSCLASGMLNTIVYVLFPKLMYESKIIQIDFTHLIAAPIFGAMIFQYPVGWLSDIIDRRKIIIILHILSICIIPLCIISFNSVFLVAFLFLLGGLMFSIYPISITHTCDLFRHDEYLLIIQTLLLVYGVGCIIGPNFAIIFTHFFSDLYGVFIAVAIISLASAIYAFWAINLKPFMKIIEKVGFGTVQTPTTPVSIELNPITDTQDEAQKDQQSKEETSSDSQSEKSSVEEDKG